MPKIVTEISFVVPLAIQLSPGRPPSPPSSCWVERTTSSVEMLLRGIREFVRAI